MQKLILVSVIFAMVVIPALTARDHDAQRGFKRTLIQMLAFFAAYAFMLLYVWNPFE
jgi:hypothetical protein